MSKIPKPSISRAEKLLFERVLSDVKPLENVGSFTSSVQETIKVSQRDKNATGKDLSKKTKSKSSQKPLF